MRLPHNHGKPWTAQDYGSLKRWHHNGRTVFDLACILGRTEIAIEAKLEKLGLWPKSEPKDELTELAKQLLATFKEALEQASDEADPDDDYRSLEIHLKRTMERADELTAARDAALKESERLRILLRNVTTQRDRAQAKLVQIQKLSLNEGGLF